MAQGPSGVTGSDVGKDQRLGAPVHLLRRMVRQAGGPDPQVSGAATEKANAKQHLAEARAFFSNKIAI